MAAQEQDYRLSPEKHAEISRDIQAKELSRSQPVDRPRAIILAGQPGAGKGSLVSAALGDMEGNGKAVFIDVDDLRAYHPSYDALGKADDRTAASHVQHDAGTWGNELRQAAIAQRHNIIVDGTLKSEKSAARMYGELRAAGYDVEVRVMATRPDESWQGVHMRYERIKADGVPGRWVPRHVHDAAYAGMPRSVERLERDGCHVSVFGRPIKGPPRSLYETGAGTNDAPSAIDAIRLEQQRQRTAAEERDFLAKQHSLDFMILTRDPELREPENRQLMESRPPWTQVESPRGSMASRIKAGGATPPKRPPTKGY